MAMDKEKDNNLDLPEIDFGADDLGDFDLNHDFKDEGAEESLLPVIDDMQGDDDLTFASTDGLPEIDWGDSPGKEDSFSDLTEIKDDAVIPDYKEDLSTTDEIVAEPSFDDDGPIALSEDELDNILDSGVLEDEISSDITEPAMAEGRDEVLLEKEDDGWDLSVSPDEFDQYLDDLDVDDTQSNDRIELVDDESESSSAFSSDYSDAMSDDYLEDSFDSDDDGPIALTDEELGNIVSEISTADIDAALDDPSDDYSKAVDKSDSPHEADDSYAASPYTENETEERDSAQELKLSDSWETEDSKESFFEDEDEGPVALSNDELNSILEDVSDADEEELKGLPQSDTVVAAAVPDRTELIDQAALESNLKKDELRKMISYLDGLFDQLPDDTIKEFSRSEYFDLYKKIMHELELDK